MQNLVIDGPRCSTVLGGPRAADRPRRSTVLGGPRAADRPRRSTLLGGPRAADSPRCSTQDRAATLSAIYLASYAGAAVPGLIAGQLSHSLGLFDIALGYGALAVIACAITLARARDRRSVLRPTAA